MSTLEFERAAEVSVNRLLARGIIFTVDDVLRGVPVGIRPEHSSHVGTFMQRMAYEGKIQTRGWSANVGVASKGRPVRTWGAAR